MKKVLLSFAFIYCTMVSMAQLRLSEFYSQPSSGTDPHNNSEFFELGLDPTQNTPQNTDEYVLLTYFHNASNAGFYLIDLPNVNVFPGGFFVGAPKTSFTFQNGHGPWNADFNWNSSVPYSSVTKYTYNGSSYDAEPVNPSNPATFFYDILTFTSNNALGDFTTLLFKKNGSEMQLLDGFIASEAEDRYTIPAEILALPDLNFTLQTIGGNVSTSIKFDNQSYPKFELGAVPLANDAADDGYFFCSAWDMVSNTSTNPPLVLTPGTFNTGLQGQALTAITDCLNPSNFVTVKVDGGAVSAYPITASLYVDIVDAGKLDINNGDIKRSQIIIRNKNITYRMPKLPGDGHFILVLDAEATCFDAIIPFSCADEIGLPVTLKSFNAIRNGSTVQLSWQTATESNNRGFYVQRNMGNGIWEGVDFIVSKALDGNSSTGLSYSFVDANTNKGVTQYRLRQLDRDGKGKYTDIRSVRGLSQLNKTILYPNPSNDGNINLVFDNASGSKNILVSDMTGRIIKQFKGITSSSMQIENLMTGLYNIRITNTQTGQSNTERIAVVRQ
jgi:hypothetical protein